MGEIKTLLSKRNPYNVKHRTNDYPNQFNNRNKIMSSKVLAHTVEGIEILLTEEKITNPSLIINELQDLACPQRIGIIQLRSLINGNVESVGDFMIIDRSEETPEVETKEVKVETKEVKVEVSNDDLSALLAEEEIESNLEVLDEIKEVEVLEEPIVEKEVKVEVEKETKTDVSKVKKALGLEGANLTPSQKSTTTRKTRSNVEETLLEAKKGENKELIEHLESEGFNLFKISGNGRYMYFINKDETQHMKSKRFDVSKLKSGNVSVSLYVEGKASGAKVMIKKDEGLGAVSTWMKTDKEVLAALK